MSVNNPLKEDIRDIDDLCKFFKNNDLSSRYKTTMMQYMIKFLSSSKTSSSEKRNFGSSAPPSHRGPRGHLAKVPLSRMQ